MKTLLRLILTIAFSFPAWTVCGHEIPVHKAITVHAAASAFSDSPAYTEFIGIISADLPLKDATDSMVEGAALEDALPNVDPVGGFRSLNHFYDPLTGLGLSNIPLDDRIIVNGEIVPVGRDSFTWASTRDCPGFDIRVNGIGVNVNTYNEWSWQNARDHEWLGLTATTHSSRQAALLEMFRAVGQVVHLLEDASQPEHTRNEQHLWPGSPIEEYGGGRVGALNYQHSMLDWRNKGFTKLKDFWDRNLYNGDGAALDEDAGGGAKLGMAEFSNGNFLGARHQYPEYFTPGSVQHYPLPSRDNSTNYKQVKADPAIGLDTYTLKNGNEAKGIYIKKNGDGVTVVHLSRINYLGAKKLSGLAGKAFCTIKDDNVLADYHSILIPRAVEYSAGLLDYLFRGRIEVVSVVWAGTAYTITIRNKSADTLMDGGFTVLKEEVNGDRSPVTPQPVPLTQTVADNATWQFNFPGPQVTTATKFIVVYQGTVGLTAGGASDPVDAGRAVAAAVVEVCASAALLNGAVWTEYSNNDFNGGSSSMVAAGNSFSGQATTPSVTADAGNAGFANTGSGKSFYTTIVYQGPALTGCVKFTFNGTAAGISHGGVSPYGQWQTSASVYAEIGGPPILNETVSGTGAAVNYSFSFNIPECLVPTNITFSIGMVSSADADSFCCEYPPGTALATTASLTAGIFGQ